MKKTPKDIGFFIGQAIAVTVAGCLALCMMGGIIALTIKFLTWIF